MDICIRKPFTYKQILEEQYLEYMYELYLFTNLYTALCIA